MKDFLKIFFISYKDRTLAFWMKLVITVIWLLSIPLGLIYGAPANYFLVLGAMILISLFTLTNELNEYNSLLELFVVLLEGILSFWIFRYAPIGYFSMFFLLIFSVGIVFILGLWRSMIINLFLLVYLFYMLQGPLKHIFAQLYNANLMLRFPYLYICILSSSYITMFSIQRYWQEKETRHARLEARIRQEKHKLAEMSMDVIQSMYGALSAKIPGIDEHCKNVATLTQRMAQKMDLDATTCQNAYYAGLLHEVGAIGLPDEILCTPHLTEDQYRIYKTYVRRGYQIIKELQIVDTVAEAVRYHRENYDGSGYLEGLKGNEIPVLSRLLAIADYTDRHLRSGETTGHVIELLDFKRGKAFDPICVDLMYEILKSKE